MKIVIIDSTLLGAIFDFDRGQPKFEGVYALREVCEISKNPEIFQNLKILRMANPRNPTKLCYKIISKFRNSLHFDTL